MTRDGEIPSWESTTKSQILPRRHSVDGFTFSWGFQIHSSGDERSAQLLLINFTALEPGGSRWSQQEMNFKQIWDGTLILAFFFPTQGVMGAVPTGAVATDSKGSSTRECTRSGGGKFGDKEQPFHLPSNKLIQAQAEARWEGKDADTLKLLGHYFQFPEVNQGSFIVIKS